MSSMQHWAAEQIAQTGDAYRQTHAVQSMNIQPKEVSVPAGSQAQLQLVGKLADGTSAPSVAFGGATFASANPDIATVSKTGQIIGISEGKTFVVAKLGGLTAAVPVTVTATQAPEIVSRSSDPRPDVGQRGSGCDDDSGAYDGHPACTDERAAGADDAAAGSDRRAAGARRTCRRFRPTCRRCPPTCRRFRPTCRRCRRTCLRLSRRRRPREPARELGQRRGLSRSSNSNRASQKRMNEENEKRTKKAPPATVTLMPTIAMVSASF